MIIHRCLFFVHTVFYAAFLSLQILSFVSTVVLFITIFSASISGALNMRSDIISSMILLSPLAPIFFFIACSAIALTASSVNSSSISSKLNNSWYSFTSAFFGTVSMWTRSSTVSLSSCTITGSLPSSSGVIPYPLSSV